jgi:hypothetical protein
MSSLIQRRALLGVPLPFDFYIDFENGDDSRSGRSPATAFRSADPITAMGTPPVGARIGVKRVSSPSILSRSQLRVTQQGIKIAAFGTGYRPMFAADDVIPANAWTLTSGKTKTYQTTIALPGDVSVEGNIFFNGVPIVQVTSVDLTEATAGSAYVSAWGASSATLYVHLAGDVNPGLGTVLIEFSRRAHAVRVTGDYSTIQGIGTRRNAHQGGSLFTDGHYSTWSDLRIEDGCRHCALSFADLTADNVTFYRGLNSLEPPTANQLVVFENSVAGRSVMMRNCTFDGGGQTTITGFDSHGADINEVLARTDLIDCTFKDLVQCTAMVAALQYIVRPVFNNVVNCISGGKENTYTEISGATGTVNQMTKHSANNVEIYSHDNTVTVPSLPTFGFHNFEGTAAPNSKLHSVNETILVQAYTGTGDLFRMASGQLVRRNCNVGPNLGAPFNQIDRLGFSGGTITIDSDQNHWSYGQKFIINGTTYSLSGAKAALYEGAASVADGNGGTPSNAGQVFDSDNFNRADEYLDVSPKWTRAGGVANMAGVRSNKLSMLGTTLTPYLFPDIGQANFFVEFTIASVPAVRNSFPVLIRYVDSLNWLGVDWDATKIYLYRSVAGTINGAGSYTYAPQVGDVVRIVMQGNKYSLYVNETVAINNVTYTAPAVDAATRVGTLPRSAALDPALDNYIHGYA